MSARGVEEEAQVICLEEGRRRHRSYVWDKGRSKGYTGGCRRVKCERKQKFLLFGVDRAQAMYLGPCLPCEYAGCYPGVNSVPVAGSAPFKEPQPAECQERIDRSRRRVLKEI